MFANQVGKLVPVLIRFTPLFFRSGLLQRKGDSKDCCNENHSEKQENIHAARAFIGLTWTKLGCPN
jgi:hypothetical protein